MRVYLDANNIDSRDRKYWEFIRPEAPARSFRRFKPIKEFEAARLKARRGK